MFLKQLTPKVIAKGTFHTLLLIEPIIREGPYNVDDFPFSVIAAKRKESFNNIQEAIENFKSKKDLYATWERRCFDLHVTKGLRYVMCVNIFDCLLLWFRCC